MISERLILYVSSISWKLFAGLFTTSAAFFGFIIGEISTSHLGMAGVAGAIGTALAAMVLVVPRVMEQRRKSRESAAKLQSDVLTKMTELHERDVNFYKNRVAALELIMALHVKAKHDAIEEWSSMKDGYLILVGQLRALGQKPDIELQPKSYRQVIGSADDEIKAIAKTRVEESPPLT